MNDTIAKIKALLIDASERQHESSFKVEIINKIIDGFKDDIKRWGAEKKDVETEMNTPRDMAKELALKYVLDGQDSTLLPRALGVRYRKGYQYDHAPLVGWLLENGHVDILKVDNRKLKALFDERGTDDSPVTEVQNAEITCDTDLKWMTDDYN